MHTPPLLTRRLDNGLLAVALQRPGDTALLNVDVRVGSRFESRQDHGLSHFLEHMIFQGSASVPAPRRQPPGRADGRRLRRLDGPRLQPLQPLARPQAPARERDAPGRSAAPAGLQRAGERARIIVEESLDEFDEDGHRLVDADTIARRALWPRAPRAERHRLPGEPPALHPRRSAAAPRPFSGRATWC
ncbi:MAG: insulinase family protein [bacterium]